LIKVLDGHKDVQYSYNDSLIVSRFNNKNAKIFDLDKGKETILQGHTSKLWSISFSPDGKKIITGSDDGTARLWDLQSTELMLLKGHTSQVMSANFSPDGKYVVTASGDGTARVWNIDMKENPIFKGHTGYVVDANFSPDGSQIVTAGWDYTARVWDKSGELLSMLKHNLHYGVDKVGFDNNNVLFTLDGYGEGVIFWGVAGLPIDTLAIKDRIPANGFDYFMEYNLLFSENNNLYIFHKTTCIDTLPGILFAKFIPKTSKILTFSSDSTLSILQQQSKADSLWYKETQQLKIHRTSFTTAEFSKDSKWMVTASTDSTLRIWDTGKILVH